jgi:hypothetical protein
VRSLIRKEWRESRALILGFLILAPLTSLALKGLLIGFAKTAALDSLMFFIPATFALFVFALSADLAAADISSGRMGFFAALPMPPTRLWRAKIVFLAGSSLLYLGYVLGVEALLLSLLGKDPETLFSPQAVVMALPIFAVVAAGAMTFLTSTLIDRGFGAALAGFGTVAGVWVLLQSGNGVFSCYGLAAKKTYLPAGLLLATAALVGSFLVFKFGRVHLKARLRRVLIGAGTMLLIVGFTTVWAGTSLAAWADIDPEEDGVIYSPYQLTPDRHWAIVSVSRPGRGLLGTSSPTECWAVGLSTGIVRELDSFGMPLRFDHEQNEGPGRLVLHRWERISERESQLLRVVYDLDEGRPVTTRAVIDEKDQSPGSYPMGPHRRFYGGKNSYLLHRDGRRFDDLAGWSFRPTASDWGIVVTRWRGGQERAYGLFVFDTGEVAELPGYPHLLPPAPDGVALSFGRAPLRLPLDGSDPEPFGTGPLNGWAVSPDSSSALVCGAEGTFLVRASDGSAQRIEGIAPSGASPRFEWAPDSKSCVLWLGTSRPVLLSFVGDGASVEVAACRLSGAINGWRTFDGRRILGTTKDCSRLYIEDLKGTTRQLLPAR